jgi:hypothetical protein
MGALLLAVAVGLALAGTAVASVKRQQLATEVRVTFTNTGFAVAPGTLNSQLASFDVALVLVNHGTKPHVLTIKGPGLSGAPTKPGVLTQRIGPGSSATLRLKLLTGAYQLSDQLGAKVVHWLVVHPATVGTPAGKPQGSPVNNPAFAPGQTPSASSMDCI